MNNQNSNNFKDEIDLNELFLALWNRKILILLTTSIFAISSVLYSLSLPNIYTSTALLAPATQDESLTSKIGNYSSLATIAGISLPGGSSGKSSEAIERIKSYDFFNEQLLPYIKIENLIAAKKWDQGSDKIIYDDKLYDVNENKWVRKVSFPMPLKPSNQEAYIEYSKILAISQDKKTKFVSISIEHVSPFLAKEWLQLIIKNINNHMRDLDKTIAENSINFINDTSQKTNLSEIKGALSKLLENQIQTLMLAEATSDYIFKRIASPMAPEKKSKPSRSIICILGTLLGLIFGTSTALYLHYFNFKKT